MHALPVGESPGWLSSTWTSLELSQSNIWNAPTHFTRSDTNAPLYYSADYEQTSFILDIGQEIYSWLALSVEVAGARRDGGMLDHIIDRFHIHSGAQQFSRKDYPFFSTDFSVQQNGEETITDHQNSALSYLKYKLKLWLIDGSSKNCPCGLSLSLQAKQPLQKSETGYINGLWYASAGVHIGFPIFSSSAFWFSAMHSWLSENPVMAGWPVIRSHQMYDVHFDFASTDSFGYLFQVRFESPLVESGQLGIIHFTESPEDQTKEQLASGLNAMEHWRVFQAIGLRYSLSETGQFRFLFVEDLGFGQIDRDGSSSYTVNAPDVAIVTQLFFGY